MTTISHVASPRVGISPQQEDTAKYGAGDVESWRSEQLEPVMQFITYIVRHSLTLVEAKDAEWTP